MFSSAEGQRVGPMMTTGCGSVAVGLPAVAPFVFARVVAPGPAPRSVTPFQSSA